MYSYASYELAYLIQEKKMVDFRVVISDSKTTKAYQLEVSGAQASRFLGKSIGDVIGGDTLGLGGYTFKITGGTDRDGFPMRGDLPGPKRRKVLVAGGVGYSPKARGVRRRKSIRGKEISAEVGQINLVIAEYGAKPISEILGKAPASKPEAKEAGK